MFNTPTILHMTTRQIRETKLKSFKIGFIVGFISALICVVVSTGMFRWFID